MTNYSNCIFLEKLELEELEGIINNKLKMEVILQFFVKGELSLTQLKTEFKKSKPTIHRHLKRLLASNIIELSREKKVRGSIKAKYYKLTDEFVSMIKLIDTNWLAVPSKLGENCDNFLTFIKAFRLYYKILKNQLNILDELIKETNYDMDIETQILYQKFKNVNPSLTTTFLTAEQYKQMNILFQNFLKKIERIVDQNPDTNSKAKYPYFFSTVLIKMDKLLDLK